MKPYGVKRKDRGCCPGHDKFPADTYSNRKSKRAHKKAKHDAHSRARSWERAEVHRAVPNL